jgi:protein SFI1
MFYRWLSAARSARHRRITLQGKEDQMKAACIAVTWNKWRERFVDEKLRPVVSILPHLPLAITSDRSQEYDVIIQSQRNMLFHAFGIWQSKTKVSLLYRSVILTYRPFYPDSLYPPSDFTRLTQR